MSTCILIPILVGIISAILGWLLRHLTCNCDDELKEIELLKKRNRKLEEDLEACLSRKTGTVPPVSPDPIINTTTSGIAAKSIVDEPVVEAEPALIFDADAAKAVMGKKVIADDLKVVEGIGPKIEQLFHENGVKTWYQLSKTSVDRCQEILNIGGKRYEIHRPATWPKQAGLAFDGKWTELKELQDYLDGGKDRA